MAQCNICNITFSESELTTITPSQYLGQAYPDRTSFCPSCFQKFLTKAQNMHIQAESEKKDRLKDFVNN